MGEGRLVLLVEDNPDDEELTLRVLRRHDVECDIVVVRDGEEAVDYLFRREDGAAAPDLILLDLKIPKLTGFDVLRRIRNDQRTKCIPVVVMTSSSEEQDVMKSYESGANSYVRKPVGFRDFEDAVRKVGVYWLSINQGLRTV